MSCAPATGCDAWVLLAYGTMSTCLRKHLRGRSEGALIAPGTVQRLMRPLQTAEGSQLVMAGEASAGALHASRDRGRRALGSQGQVIGKSSVCAQQPCR